MPLKVIQVVVGALETTPKKLQQPLNDKNDKNSKIAENYNLIFCKVPPKCS